MINSAVTQRLVPHFTKLLALMWLLSGLSADPLSPTLFDGMRWRLVGPFRAGRVVAVTGTASQPNTFYFGGVDGGIWKTTDAGTVWEPTFDKEPVGSIGAIEVAPSNPKVIYAGTGESDIRSDLASGDGVYKSIDAGKTWTNVGLRNSRQISRVVIDPSNANHIYIAALGDPYGPSSERGVFESRDGGITWKKSLNKGPNIGAADLAMASDAPQVLLASMWNAHRVPWSTYAPVAGPGSGLYLSRDGGETWRSLTGNGLPTGDWGRIAVGIAAGTNGRRLYALIEIQADAKKSGLYRSDDGGVTWTCLNADPRLTSRQWYFATLTVDPRNPDVVYIPNVALYRSKDGGKTFSVLRGAPGGDDYHQIWVSPADPTRMVLGTDQGTTISVDDGTTWSTWYNQPTAQFYHVVTDNATPYWIYGAQQDSGSAMVASRTNHGQITARDWNTASGSESGYLAPDPRNPDILYVTDTYGDVQRFNKRTELSQNIAPWPVSDFDSPIRERKYRATWTPVLVFSPFDRRSLYLGMQFVMKTVDGGLHWQSISPDLTEAAAPAKEKQTTPPTTANAKERGYGTVFTIAPSPLRANEIWAGTDTGLIHLSLNGRTWKNVTPSGLSDWSKISLIEASHFDPAVAYAAVDRSRLSDNKPYIYRTQNYGKSWQLIAKGIPDGAFVRAVREDPIRKGLLFAGTELGVYVSFNDGADWQSLQRNLPVTSVRDLAIHSEDLIAATHGRSFWVLDNITPLRQANKQIEDSPAYLYKPALGTRIDNDTFPGTPLPPEEPAAANPQAGVYIDYVLQSAVTAPITLELLDATHHVIRHFSSQDKITRQHEPLPIAERWFPEPQHLEGTAGMHRFIWDLRSDSSGVPSAEEDEESSAPAGPRVPPGRYEIRLTATGKMYLKPLTVRMDPNSPATQWTLLQQFTLGRKMYAETLVSRQALAEITSVQAQLTRMRGTLGGAHPDILRSLDGALAAIDKILKGSHDDDSHDGGSDDGLTDANTGLTSALRVIESGDRTPPVQAIQLYKQSSAVVKTQAKNWKDLKAGALTLLNTDLREQNMKTVEISEIEKEVYRLMTR
jgi:photosystem II stability/assembly factor-like uncharacterized protein